MQTPVRRAGWTLIELLVVFGVLAIAFAMVLVSVQKARVAAVVAVDRNQLRQLALGLQGFAAAHDGKVPGPVDPTVRDGVSLNAPIFHILPFVEGEPGTPVGRPKVWTPEEIEARYPARKVLISHLDPTPELLTTTFPGGGSSITMRQLCSYAANMCAFTGPPRLADGFPDGTSNTIAYTEKYAACFTPQVAGGLDKWCVFLQDYPNSNTSRLPGDNGALVERPPSFAHPGWKDVVPVTKNGTTSPSVAGKTFQTEPQPLLGGCDPTIPVAGSRAGLVAAMFDGSVRTIRPGVAETTFWAAVTRTGGEVAPLD